MLQWWPVVAVLDVGVGAVVCKETLRNLSVALFGLEC